MRPGWPSQQGFQHRLHPEPAAMAKTVDQGLLNPIDLEPDRTGAKRFHLQTVQRRLDMDHLEWGELQDGCMNSPRQADPASCAVLVTPPPLRAEPQC